MSYVVVLLSVMAVHSVVMISPGPTFLVVTQTSISRSRREGVWTALGVACAAFLWSAAALLGVSLFLETTAWLYQGMKLLGGAYLIYLGIKSWRSAGKQPKSAAEASPTASGRRSFRIGFITNLSNPKAVIFFSSIFASLLPPHLPLWMRAAAVGVIVFDALCWHVALALAFSTRPAQQLYTKAKRTLDYVAGGFLILIGTRLVLVRK